MKYDSSLPWYKNWGVGLKSFIPLSITNFDKSITCDERYYKKVAAHCVPKTS